MVWRRVAVALLLLLVRLGAAQTPARAADTVTIGQWVRLRRISGRCSSVRRRDSSPRRISALTSSMCSRAQNLVQQLAAGSLDITMSTGLVDRSAPSRRRRRSHRPPRIAGPALCIDCQVRDQVHEDSRARWFRWAGPRTSPGSYVERCSSRMASSPANSTWCLPVRPLQRPRAAGRAVDAAIVVPAVQLPGVARVSTSSPHVACAGASVLRLDRQPQLGGKTRRAATDPGRSPQERGWVLRSDEPRRAVASWSR